jgi:rhamnosyltransferase
MIAGIVTYNPEIERLKENLCAVKKQIDEVLVIDNSSKNIQDIEKLLKDFSKVSLIKNAENLGVASALNQEAKYAIENGYEWLLSLDQDSVIPDGLMKEYQKYIDNLEIGMICCKIKDRNFGELDYNASNIRGTEYISTCITSASMIRLSAWEKVGGYYEPLFIDSVDFDICYSLQEAGYKILRTNDFSLLHEVGHGKKVHFLGKDRQLVNHSPLRYYYIFRNGLFVARRHGYLIKGIKHYIFSFLIVNLFEKNKIAKDRMIFKGLWHFVKGKLGKYDE